MFTAIISHGQLETKNFLSAQQLTDLRNALHKNIADSIRFRTLLRLAKYYFENGSDERPSLDSAGQYIRNAKEISLKLSPGRPDPLVLLFEASLARRGGNFDSGLLLINQAIKQLETSKDQFHLAEAYLELSHCHDPKDPKQTHAIKSAFTALFKIVPTHINTTERDSLLSVLMNDYILEMSDNTNEVRLDFLEQLTHSYQLVNDRMHELRARKEQADIHFQQGHLNIAIIELVQIASEQKQRGYPGICLTYDLLSGLYYMSNDYNKSLFYSLETIRNIKTASDSSYLADFYSRVAYSYFKTGSLAEAAEWSRRSLKYRIERNNMDGIYAVMYDLTGFLIKLKRAQEAIDMVNAKRKKYPPVTELEKKNMLQSLAEAYSSLHQNTTAEKYCKELIQVYRNRSKQTEMEYMINQQRLYGFLAGFYFDEGKFDEAEKYFKKSMEEVPESARKSSSIQKSQLKFLFKLDSARGNFLSAIKHLDKYQAFQDSIQASVKTKQIEELKVAYQTEQKDLLINLKEQNIQLLTKQDQLQKVQLRQGATLRNISFAAAALMVIIMGLLYNRYRLKQRTNKQLEMQQSEITKQNVSLHHLVNEKDWLVKEIHHRVKNNLQIVMSLLNSQSTYINNERALTAIHDSQHRVHAMSLIHQKLYNTENVSSIDISLYIREMVSYLSESFNTGQRIRFECDIKPLEMDVSRAVPLGLILNEAITNAIKYAFPDGRSGVISISLDNTGGGHWLLNITDNGIGIPDHFKNKKPGSLGMSLIAGLSEDIDGNFSLESSNGTTVKILFVHDLVVKRRDPMNVSSVLTN